MGIKLYQVDAFTEKPFAGNPAAVCFLPRPGDGRWMQQVAAEMNLSETAFLFDEGDVYHLRWFTPTTEIEMCGHATLASAHVLWESGVLAGDAQAKFRTMSGMLTADRIGEEIQLNFPALPVEEDRIPDGLAAVLGAEPLFGGRSGEAFLVEMEDECTVRGLEPDFGALARVEVRGVIVTARSSSKEFDFVSRFFAPRLGINEDPVTGAAHCSLAPYWSDKLGKRELVAFQASARGGIVGLSLNADRVDLRGRAITVFTAELHV